MDADAAVGTLACAGGRCTPPSAIVRDGSTEEDEQVGAGPEKTPPADWRAATGAAADTTTPSGFAFFVMRKAAVDAGIGSAVIDVRALRLEKSAEVRLEIVGAPGTCSFVFGRTNCRTGACGAREEGSESIYSMGKISLTGKATARQLRRRR